LDQTHAVNIAVKMDGSTSVAITKSSSSGSSSSGGRGSGGKQLKQLTPASTEQQQRDAVSGWPLTAAAAASDADEVKALKAQLAALRR